MKERLELRPDLKQKAKARRYTQVEAIAAYLARWHCRVELTTQSAIEKSGSTTRVVQNKKQSNHPRLRAPIIVAYWVCWRWSFYAGKGEHKTPRQPDEPTLVLLWSSENTLAWCRHHHQLEKATQLDLRPPMPSPSPGRAAVKLTLRILCDTRQ